MPNYKLEDLLYLMQRLRDPVDGCPWDKVQSFESVVPHTIEETYELADAIANQDMVHIKEELGDVLFQVIFYSQMASEQQAFTMADVINDLTGKLIRRHPHVFPEGHLQSRAGEQSKVSEQVKETWEAIKSQERQQKQLHSVIDDVPIALPALIRAEKLQKRAARSGFDWPTIEPVLEKLQEELAELLHAKAEDDAQAIEDELGDVLFTCVNLARHLQVKPEMALRRSNQKFERRFRYIEQQLSSQNQSIETASLEQLDGLWNAAKQFEV